MALKKKTKHWLIVSLCAVALFFAYAVFPLSIQGIWNAPDETAAAWTVGKLPLLTGEYNQPAAYAEELGGLVHPRSMLVHNQQLVPAMWLGLPWLLNAFGRLTGNHVETLELIVVLISVLAVFSWKQIVTKLFENPTVGWIAAFVLAVHPGWWYFTARGFHPNVLFVSLLIFGVLAWYVGASHRPPKRAVLWRDLMLFLGGLSFGMAIFVRTNEAIWIVPLLLLVAWYQRRKPFKDHLLAVLGVAIPLLLMLNLQAMVYGDTFLTGYTIGGDPVPVEVTEHVERVGFSSPLLAQLFPFGIHEMNVLQNVTSFHVVFFALWTAFTVFGLFMLGLEWRTLRADKRQLYKRLLWLTAIVSAYLFVVYGSWNISDNPDPSAVTIGTSYIRYWLPISLAMTALVGYAIVRGVSYRYSETMRQVVIGIWLVAFGYAGFAQAVYGRDEGLAFVHQNLLTFQAQQERVLEVTSFKDTEVIIVDRADKIFFPHRQVVYPLRSQTTYEALPAMIDAARGEGGVYYFGVKLPEEDLDHLREVELEPRGVDIVHVSDIEGDVPMAVYMFGPLGQLVGRPSL